jgi:hypothetical protein
MLRVSKNNQNSLAWLFPHTANERSGEQPCQDVGKVELSKTTLENWYTYICVYIHVCIPSRGCALNEKRCVLKGEGGKKKSEGGKKRVRVGKKSES